MLDQAYKTGRFLSDNFGELKTVDGAVDIGESATAFLICQDTLDMSPYHGGLRDGYSEVAIHV